MQISCDRILGTDEVSQVLSLQSDERLILLCDMIIEEIQFAKTSPYADIVKS
jgi:hypothetical protein